MPAGIGFPGGRRTGVDSPPCGMSIFGREPSRSRRRGAERDGRSTVKIEVLGTGCPKCQSLAKNVEAAVRELGLAATVEKVMDIEAIAKRGVMVTPALAIDGEIKSVGRALTVGQVRVLLGGTR